MTGTIQGMNAAMVSDMLTALHGRALLGPELPYAALTFKPPATNDFAIIHYEFAKHVGAQRFVDNADAVAACLKQHDQADIDVLAATVPLADAIERMHDTIRKLAYISYEYLCSAEKRAVIPLERNILLLREADTDVKRATAWRALRKEIKKRRIIPFLEKINSFLYSAGDRSRKRRIIFGARPDSGPNTEHFQLVREFLHNISNGLLPFTLELQMLRETLKKLPANPPEAALFDDAIKDLTVRIEKWYTAYELGTLTLHRYFVIDLLEKTCRQELDPVIQVLAPAAAAGSPSALRQVRSTLEARLSGQNYERSLLAQGNELSELIQRIADWHDGFAARTRGTNNNLTHARLLVEISSVAASALFKLTDLIPLGDEEVNDQLNVRRFYVQLGRFHAVRKMVQKLEGWDSRIETHMQLPY